MSGAIDDLLSRRVLFVTGKGGVGKSTAAAALALLAAERGRRTLLIDVEAKGDAARFLDAYPPRYKPKEALDGLWHLALDPENALDEYLRISIKLPRFYRAGPVSKVFDFIANAAPGVREVLIAGKVGFEERAKEDGRPRWDQIVVDAAPAGQVLKHLRGPKTLQELVQVGMIRNQTDWVREIIEDPQRTGIVVVAVAEEMPVQETAELLEDAPEQVGTPVVGIVANRVVAPPGSPEAVEALTSNRDAAAEALGGRVDLAADALDLFARLARNQAPHLERLRSLGPPVLDIPFMPIGRHELRSTRAVAAALDGRTPEPAEVAPAGAGR